MRNRTRVALCGEKKAAEDCLEFLDMHDDTELCAIIAAPKDWQANLIAWGAQRRIKTYVGNINDYVDELAALELDFLFSVQYRSRLGAPVLNVSKHGCVNLHFGMLPRYGGCYPVAWAILNGESEAGITLHQMTEAFDEGNILAQTSVPIEANTTARTLFDCMSARAALFFAETYPALREGSLEPKPQDLTKKLYYDKDSIDFDKDRRINWADSAEKIQRQIAAFTFPPFQLPTTRIGFPGGRSIEATISSAGGTSQSITVQAGNGQDVEISTLDGQDPHDFFAALKCTAEDATFLAEGE